MTTNGESVDLDEVSRLNQLFLNTLKETLDESPHEDLRPKFDRYKEEYMRILKNPKDEHPFNTSNHTPTSSDTLSPMLDKVRDEIRSFNFEEDGDTVIKVHQYISWDEYFMSVAQLAARRSKDPSTQVGACIVNAQNKIVATGYNGMPNGVNDKSVPWTKEGPYLETKYAYVVHAELNAILNCILTDQTGCRVYVSLFPCNECAKAIIQSGIRLVIYLSDKHRNKDSTKAAKRMFQLAGVVYKQYSEI